MKKIHTVLTTRPFQPLFAAMETLLREAEPLHREIMNKKVTGPYDVDKTLWAREKHLATGSFIMGIMGIEAFVNCLWAEFPLRRPPDMPYEWFGGKGRIASLKERPFERWKLQEKVFFIPSICCSTAKPPKDFFKKNSRHWQRFDEVVAIRHRLAHARPVWTDWKITLGQDKLHTVDDSKRSNFWARTEIPKDIRGFNYGCAQIGFEEVTWVRDSIMTFLVDRVPSKYLHEEVLQILE